MKDFFKNSPYIIIGIIVFVISLISVTFAWYSYVDSQTEGGTAVNSGTLQIKYTDGTIITANNLMPALEPSNTSSCGDGTCYKNSFTVKNTGTIPAYVSGKLNISSNTFESNKLMYKIVDENTTIMAASSIPTSNNVTIFEGLTLAKTESKTYTLIIWLDSTATNASQGKTMSGNIELNATQVVGNYVKLDGILYDNNNNILANTNMELHSQTKYTITNSEGYFDFGNVETGEHTIIAKDSNDTIILSDTITLNKGSKNITGKTITSTSGISLNIKINATTTIDTITEMVTNPIPEDPDPVPVTSALPLPDGLIPVKYNGTTLVKADASNSNDDWYNYDSKLWANAVMVNSTSRTNYMNASAGTSITESDVLAYYVWIPRYKYKLFDASFGYSEPQEIDVIFESTTDTISNGTTNGEYLSHPAFWWDNDSDGTRETSEELAGIWVGKFELTGTENTPTILPNVTSLRDKKVSVFFNIIKSFENTTYLTSTGVTQVDSHMIKNIEW